MNTNRPKALYALDPANLDIIYGPDEQRRIAGLADVHAPVQSRETIKSDPAILKQAEVILSGWGAPVMDSQFLAPAMNVESCSIDEIFEQSDVISLHTPDLPATKGMIRGRHFGLMKPGATFINTARGAVVNEVEMIGGLSRRPEVTAVLDVTDPEPSAQDSLLTKLPNVVLTPHLAGSAEPECQRLGYYMLEEYERYLAGRPLKYGVTREAAATMA